VNPRSQLPLPDLPEELARCGGWTPDVYRDMLAYQSGRLDKAEFDAKYLYRKAILVMDLTDFTTSCFNGCEIQAFLRILDAQKICVPVLREHDAGLIRAFADDLVALFDDVGRALDAAFEMHRRVQRSAERALAGDNPPRCCIGVGYGEVYAFGPNLAMGDEMNRASKLGEDTARGTETLVTENVYKALRDRKDVDFEPIVDDAWQFPYFRASRVLRRGSASA
jgi:class 3 adenylate cyclase